MKMEGLGSELALKLQKLQTAQVGYDSCCGPILQKQHAGRSGLSVGQIKLLAK